MTMKSFLPLISAAILLSACGADKKVDKSVLDAVNKSMEIKKVNEVDIINEAIDWGNEISTEAQQALMEKLTKAIEDQGVSEAIGFCQTAALPAIEEVGQSHGVTVRRVSHDYRNPNDQPNEMEEMLLQAYEYNEANGVESKPNVQEIDGDQLLYTKAITIPGPLCLQCHGDPTKDITSATLQKIQENYPNDKATGHQIGDLRGIWSITIPKKEVVKRL